jgi:hypothetical protein
MLLIGLDILDELGDAEEIVHALERHSFGFWDEEPNENEPRHIMLGLKSF